LSVTLILLGSDGERRTECAERLYNIIKGKKESLKQLIKFWQNSFCVAIIFVYINAWMLNYVLVIIQEFCLFCILLTKNQQQHHLPWASKTTEIRNPRKKAEFVKIENVAKCKLFPGVSCIFPGKHRYKLHFSHLYNIMSWHKMLFSFVLVFMKCQDIGLTKSKWYIGYSQGTAEIHLS
jgi:hypothetical protein